jgi:lauroyl/myristoyl acyltransferase
VLAGGEAMSSTSRSSARLLELLLVFSAGLCRTWKRSEILKAYPSLLEFYKLYRRIDEQLLRSREAFSVTNVDRLSALLSRFSSREIIIATAHHGHFIAFMNACARSSIPLALCYHSASRSYLEASRRNQLKLIALTGHRSVLSLFHTLDRYRANGFYVVIMMDGSFASRRRFDFLNYKVAASSLAPLYARKTHSVVLPVVPTATADASLSFTEGPIIENAGIETAQQLLDFLQMRILQQPTQYQWLSSSILLSDQRARDNAFKYASAALSWREKVIRQCTL